VTPVTLLTGFAEALSSSRERRRSTKDFATLFTRRS